MRESLTLASLSDYCNTSTQNLHLDPRALLLTITHVVVPVCVNCQSKSRPFNRIRQQAINCPASTPLDGLRYTLAITHMTAPGNRTTS